MSRPDPRQTAALSAALSRAVDLSALKARADASKAAPASTNGGAPTSAYDIEVTEADFQTEVVQRSVQVPVLVVLGATWSGQSQQVADLLGRVVADYRGAIVVARVDVDTSPRVAQLFGAQSVPMVIAIAGGQPVEAFADAPPEPQLRQWISALLDALRDRLPGIRAAEEAAPDGAAEPEPEPEDERFTAAEDALAEGDYAAAEAAYQAILDAEPSNADAKAALNQVRFMARAESAPPDAVTRADAAPDDVDLQLAAADLELVDQRPEAAFARLIAAVRRTSGEDRDRLRTHLVGLFDLFAPDDPAVGKARRDLASALF